MNKKSISTLFSEGLFWNGILYSLYKIIALASTCFLYFVLPTQEYNLWALLQSTLFLLVLVLDCGMKKTIPRYILLFAKNNKTYVRFLATLFTATISIATFIGVPLLYYTIKIYNPLHFYKNHTLVLSFLLITETILALLTTLYHAHFMQKYYYSLYLCYFTLEMILSCLCATIFYNSTSFIVTFLYIKLTIGLLMIMSALLYLPLLYKTITKQYQTLEEIPSLPSHKDIILHATSMWASTTIKALTEKNGLFPFVTGQFGIAIANSFKITHECTLFFQRIALKTIGINDTTALSYALTNETSTTRTTKTIKYKITVLCGAIFFIGATSGILYHYYYRESFLFSLFLLSLTAYMIEIVLSPFERVLETERQYRKLWLRYSPYIILITVALIFKWYVSWSLIQSILYIHIARLISALLMVY